MNILIIEDNPMNMKLASDILRRQGYTVLQATDADAGIKIAIEQRPTMILMDIQLPGMDGLTATKLLKNNETTKDIKIIALTAFAMKGDEERMIEAGCDAYISKPIRYKEFLAAVDSLTKAS
ncbi:MAG: response regulator [Candidatus Magnetobacterium sp. LHC-1]|uniref:Response regulator n=1 Tax=Candidatus Magnetobacterium casense TaxID=1455061 RepID=A0ABS6RV24_9BACT|nr:response regulator [Candidatus Magnetobacterium casensis]MBF0607377.1 response regulator [Nitrospirota bacterium]MBV6340484.1 response regulator [Candidatus Magnetobacterium casensis]